MPSGGVTPAGGAAFNGGTITSPLVVNTGATTDEGLKITGTRTSENNALEISYPHSAFIFDSDGVVTLASNDGMTLLVTGSGGTHANINVTDDSANGAIATLSSIYGISLQQVGNTKTLLDVQDASSSQVALTSTGLCIRRNTAPADAAVAANECFVWFDSTNGAAKLMLKGKSANGTVVAASIALA